MPNAFRLSLWKKQIVSVSKKTHTKALEKMGAFITEQVLFVTSWCAEQLVISSKMSTSRPEAHSLLITESILFMIVVRITIS